jgi:predicted transcriptional regulator
MTQQPKRMGRPPGSEFPHLIHVRISGDMAEWLEQIADDRMDKPTMAALVREAIASYVKGYQREAARAHR